MELSTRALLAGLITLALACGFITPVVSDGPYDVDRLHVFLLNLCVGGFVVLWMAGGRGPITTEQRVWLVLSVAYAASAFLNRYAVTLLVSLGLCAVVERTRTRLFHRLPVDLLRPEPTSLRFLHASLLCLSAGILVCSVFILNDQYLHVWHVDKLTLDVAFLFYSFPISLATFSVIFALMPSQGSRTYRLLEEVGFWGIVSGVTTFFVFIVLEATAVEAVIGSALLGVVLMVLALFGTHTGPSQQRVLLLSGLGFLVATGLSGVGYLLAHLWPALAPTDEQVMMMHASVSLYGWNLSGLIVMVRWGDFPIAPRIAPLVALHWVTVLLLVPLGKVVPAMAVVALPAFAALVVTALLGGRQPSDRSAGAWWTRTAPSPPSPSQTRVPQVGSPRGPILRWRSAPWGRRIPPPSTICR